MIVLPSIAFGGFSGSAKDVTARQVGGRSILSVRSWPTGPTTNAQVARLASISRITKSYQKLMAAQMLGWERLAEHASGTSIFGQKAELSGINMFVRLNVSRLMAGESILKDAPARLIALPTESYSALWITPKTVIIKGIAYEPGLKLVIQASGPQGNGITRAYSKATQIKLVEEPGVEAVDIRADYVAKNGAPGEAAPKIFFRYYFVNGSTGEKSQAMQTEVKWTAGA